MSKSDIDIPQNEIKIDIPKPNEPFTEIPGSFHEDLKHLINSYCIESGSNTPDFILAQYIMGCLENFDMCVRRRDEWFDFDSGDNP